MRASRAASSKVYGSLRPVGRNGTIACASIGRPLYDVGVSVIAAGSACAAEHVVVVADRLPAAAVRIAAPEPPCRAVGGSAQRFGAHLRARGRMLERAGETARFAHGALASPPSNASTATLAPIARIASTTRISISVKPRGCAHRSHEPMSASMPLPPAWPSAPKLITSISPRTPGLRYTYGRPHGSLGSFSR